LEVLTQRYARYSGPLAGLPAVWGGLVISMMGGINFGWYLKAFLAQGGGPFKAFLRFLAKGHIPLRPEGFQLACFLLPLFWSLGRLLLKPRYYEAWGRVRSAEIPDAFRGVRWANTGFAWLICIGFMAQFGWSFGLSRWLGMAGLLLLVHALQTPTFDSVFDYPTSTIVTLMGAVCVFPAQAMAVGILAMIYLMLGWMLMAWGGFFLWRFMQVRRDLQRRSATCVAGEA
jgi:hypothetical protein